MCMTIYLSNRHFFSLHSLHICLKVSHNTFHIQILQTCIHWVTWVNCQHLTCCTCDKYIKKRKKKQDEGRSSISSDGKANVRNTIHHKALCTKIRLRVTAVSASFTVSLLPPSLPSPCQSVTSPLPDLYTVYTRCIL